MTTQTSSSEAATTLADALEEIIFEQRRWADEAEVIVSLLRRAPQPVSLVEFRQRHSAPTREQSAPMPVKGTLRPVGGKDVHFPEGVSAEHVIISFLLKSGQVWKAAELRDYLLANSNFAEMVANPQSSIYQALSRGVQRGLLTSPPTGYYEAAEEKKAEISA